ncbi:MAG: MmgE/PrpD family protein [Burkholderiales bacterium]|nr:MmgE/PrpD family protein [Burkholderiales bacterium]
MTEPPDYLARLAQFVGATPAAAIPAAVLARTRAILADSFAVYAAGMQSPELRALGERLRAAGAPGRAWVIGAGRTTNALDAAMLNGTAGAWLDFDEGNTLANGHPGVQVIPAALAVAQERRIDGREFLATVALAYEVVARIGMATTPKVIVNPHGTYGVVGAALAAARLSGVAPARLRNLASLAASACMATNRHTMRDGATVRNWYAGHSAFMGQMAVRLADAGFSGPADGVATTFGLVLGDGFAPATAVADLGERWLLTEGYLKLYPTARYAHSAIDALFDALARVPGGRLDPAAIDRIEVRAYRMAAYLSNPAPKDWFGTRFSVPFAIATLIVGERDGLAAFGDGAVADRRVMDLAARVEPVEDAGFTAAYPAAQRVALTIRMRDGTVHAGHSEITSGEPARPHDPAALERKFRDLAEPIWGAARAARLHDAIMHVDTCADMGALVDFDP